MYSGHVLMQLCMFAVRQSGFMGRMAVFRGGVGTSIDAKLIAY